MWVYGYTQFWRDECVSLGLERKILLTEEQIPKSWYCILLDLPAPLPPILDPKTRKSVDPRTLEAIFPKELIRQGISVDRFVQIPEEIRDVYRLWRPTPMCRLYTYGSSSFGQPEYFSLGGSLLTGKQTD